MGQNYHHITLEERCEIAHLRAGGQSLRAIAARLGRAPSTISREISRNAGVQVGYKPSHADELAWGRRWRGCRLQRQPALRKLVVDRLAMGWSPQQVAGRLAIDHNSKLISHESIYRFIYREIRRTNDGAFRNYLPKRKSKRGWAGARFNPVLAIPDRVSISQRPKVVEKRREIGHWEADLLHPRKSGPPILVAHERVTRFLLLAKMPSKEAFHIAEQLTQWFSQFPAELRKTLTIDNGTEFFHHYKLNKIGMQTYFCKPHQPWQKGAVENSNARIRRYIPLGTDPNTFSNQDIIELARKLNNIPRKCLGFKTPAEEIYPNLLRFKCESTFPPSRE